jgi:hypothetical protein
MLDTFQLTVMLRLLWVTVACRIIRMGGTDHARHFPVDGYVEVTVGYCSL